MALVYALKNANPEKNDIEINKMWTELLDHPTDGPWANISRRFAAETSGDVLVYIGDIETASNRILWNTEIPTILELSNVRNINGVSADIFRYLYKSYNDVQPMSALEVICRTINKIPQSNSNQNFLDSVVQYFDEKGRLIGVDISAIGGDSSLVIPDNAFRTQTMREVAEIEMSKLGFDFENYDINDAELQLMRRKEISTRFERWLFETGGESFETYYENYLVLKSHPELNSYLSERLPSSDAVQRKFDFLERSSSAELIEMARVAEFKSQAASSQKLMFLFDGDAVPYSIYDASSDMLPALKMITLL